MACPSHTAGEWSHCSLAWASQIFLGSFNYATRFFKVVSSLSLYSENFPRHTGLIDSRCKKWETTFLNWVLYFYFWKHFEPLHPAVVKMRGFLILTLNIYTSAWIIEHSIANISGTSIKRKLRILFLWQNHYICILLNYRTPILSNSFIRKYEHPNSITPSNCCLLKISY